ncbi:MAG: NAD/FAD-dependent oxidoreductase [Snowella sp.]|nr:MAG: NAD/FAD-dependent oxidoreductase [Snowella sp.]
MKNSGSCLIIGGGMAGLMAATVLKRHGLDVTVLDKGRGIGGRLATRRLTYSEEIEGVFDYGAQYFTVSDAVGTLRDREFQGWVDEWLAEGVITEWSQGFFQESGSFKSSNKPCYRGTKSNRSLAQYLAQSLTVHTNAQVTRLSWQDDHWQVQSQTGEFFQGDRLILTPPVPQSLTLLDHSDIAINPEIRQKLEQVTYYPCITMLALMEKPSQIPAPGGLWGSGHPLGWIACNYQKGISTKGYAVTLQAGPEFSQNYWDQDNAEIAQQLLKAADSWLSSKVLDYQIHRWRYSQVAVSYGEPCLVLTEPGPLILAGDGFLAPKIEGAVLSGLAAARSLLPLR